MSGVSIFAITRHICNSLTYLLLGSVTFVTCIYAYAELSLNIAIRRPYYLHIILNIVGYVLVLPQAVMVYSEYNGWSNKFLNKERRVLHLMLTLCGASLSIAGSVIKITDANSVNFETLHGVFGIISLILVGLNVIGAAANLSERFQHKIVKSIYTGLCFFTILFAFITSSIGFSSDSFSKWVSQAGADALIACLALALVGVMLTTGTSINKT